MLGSIWHSIWSSIGEFIIFIVFSFLALIYDYDKYHFGYKKNVPTEFFQIEKEMYSDSTSVYETFVVSNPPQDTALRKKIIEEYNLRTLPPDTLKKHKEYTRKFYRETGSECLNRHNPKKIEDCSSRIISNNNDSEYDIMETKYYHFYEPEMWWYSYRFGLVKKGYIDDFKKIEIKDIDSFYAEQMMKGVKQ